jgi:uncharacterized phiE125 gp8 family phage protein
MHKSSAQLVTGPAAEPVSLVAAKNHLRVDGAYDDTLISALITAAREYAEHFTQRAFFTQTWTLSLDLFPFVVPAFTNWIDAFAITLPRPRLIAVTSITYYDQSGTQQTLSPEQYAVDTFSEPARLTPVSGGTWPYPSVFVPGTVKITYATGSYGDGVEVDTCPLSIQQAILLLIGHWYAQREAVAVAMMSPVPFAVEALLGPYKNHSLLV